MADINPTAFTSAGQPDGTETFPVYQSGWKKANLGRPKQGFVNRTDSTIALSTKTFTITGTNFAVYSNGVKYTKNTQTAPTPFDGSGTPTTNTLYFIYYATDGTLTVSSTPWDVTTGIIPIATVFWNGTSGDLSDERHGDRDIFWHATHHNTVGALISTAASTYFAGTYNSGSPAGATFSVADGTIYDEDIKLATGAAKTTAQVWYKASASTMTFEAAAALPYKASGGVIYYDNAGTATAVSNGNYGVTWVYASTSITSPIKIVLGTGNYNSLILAQAATPPALPIAVAEWKLIARNIYRVSGGNTTTWQETADYRWVGGTAIPGTPAAGNTAASTSIPDTTNFNGILTSSETTVQAALEKIDDAAKATTLLETGYTASATLALTDAGKTILANHATVAIAITCPQNSAVAFPVGTAINVVQTGAAAVSFAAGSGATVVSSGSKLTLTGQYSAASIIKISTNGWLLIGDVKA